MRSAVTSVRRALVPLLLVVVILGAGCAEDNTAGPAGGGPQDRSEIPTNPQDAWLAFAECMRAEGIDDYEGPKVDESGRVEQQDLSPSEDHSFDEVLEADSRCKYLLENTTIEASDEEMAELDDAMVAYTECMRKAGIPLPDPTPGTGAIVNAQAEEDDPEFAAANENCVHHLDTGIGE